MGKLLRPLLGADLVIIGGTSGATPGRKPLNADPTDIDAALAQVAIPRLLLDLRPARDDHAVLAWLSEPRSLHAKIETCMTVTLANAFDAVYFVETLTPARSRKP
jgi:erythromycin esterase